VHSWREGRHNKTHFRPLSRLKSLIIAESYVRVHVIAMILLAMRNDLQLINPSIASSQALFQFGLQCLDLEERYIIA
jgi:hypothetical protein